MKERDKRHLVAEVFVSSMCFSKRDCLCVGKERGRKHGMNVIYDQLWDICFPLNSEDLIFNIYFQAELTNIPL